jgi:peptide/nickel transport system permease protein
VIRFFFSRLVSGLLVVAGVVVVVFLLFNVLPGDPARMVLGQRADLASVEVINRELGRDLPLASQFVLYVNDLSPVSVLNVVDSTSRVYADSGKYGSWLTVTYMGEHAVVLKYPFLRRSYQTRENVGAMLMDALPGTIVLSVSALLFAAIFGIGLGILSALYKGKVADRFILFLSVTGMSVPSFFAGILVAWLFGYVMNDWTGLEMTGSLTEIDPFDGSRYKWSNLILPTLTLGIRPLSVIVQLTRSSLLEVMAQDYIRTARAKGLSEWAVIFGHALQNALNPVLTAISGWFGSLLAGAVFIEYVFGWKGVGKLTVDALEMYDFPVVMGSVLMVSVFFVLINMAVDMLYARLDPRVKME